jgi:hypothetical protein
MTGPEPSDVVTAAEALRPYVLAALLRDLGSDRAWHPSGNGDASGWAGMAITELLVHGHDVARCLQVQLDPHRDVCAGTVARVFPWVSLTTTEPQHILLAVTGRAAAPGVGNDPDWWWQSAPLDEWDGRPRRRTTAPAWR